MSEARRLGGNRAAIGAGLGAAAAGFALLGVAFGLDPREAAFAYLTAFAAALGIALGALTLLMIGHATGASWIVAIRRPVETVAAVLPVFALLFLPIALALRHLYPWVEPGPLLSEHALEVLRAKRAYLNAPFFFGRAALYFLVWCGIAALLWRWSVRDDAAPDIRRPRALSAAGFPALGLTITFAAFDWLMALDPLWFSSMFGIYFFAGGFAAALALVILLVRAWDRAGLLPEGVGPAHYHSLGKVLFTAVIFWAYAAYFQGMITWIADMPEESAWYVLRTRGGWGRVLAAAGALAFALPFLALLSRSLKRRPGRLAAVAALVLAGHFFDVYWLVMPHLHAEVRLHWATLAALLAVGGAALAYGGFIARGKAGAPRNDPRLEASLEYRTT